MEPVFKTEYGLVKAIINQKLGASFEPHPDETAKEADNYLPYWQAKFTLSPNIQPIPYSLWSAVVKLYFDFAKKGIPLEVSVMLLRDAATGTKWKILVPKQEVSSGSVERIRYNNGTSVPCIDLIDGTEYMFPDDDIFFDWDVAGSSHSHNTMQLSSFSSTDDDSELHVPGVHILVSGISFTKNTYVPTVSVVLCGKRHILTGDERLKVVQLNGSDEEAQEFHPDVLKYISQITYKKINRGKGWNKATQAQLNSIFGYGYNYSQDSLDDYDMFGLGDYGVTSTTKKKAMNREQYIQEELEYMRGAITYLKSVGMSNEEIIAEVF